MLVTRIPTWSPTDRLSALNFSTVHLFKVSAIFSHILLLCVLIIIIIIITIIIIIIIIITCLNRMTISVIKTAINMGPVLTLS